MGDQILEVAVPPLSQILSYEMLPDAPEPLVGHRVNVPLGSRTATGYIVGVLPKTEVTTNKSYKLKAIRSFTTKLPCFHEHQLNFFKRVAEYYGDSLSNVIDVAIPQSTPPKMIREILLKVDSEVASKSKRWPELLTLLKENNGRATMPEINLRFPSSSALLRSLNKSGIISFLDSEDTGVFQSAESPPSSWAKSSVTLNPEQRIAADAIIESLTDKKFAAHLLFGVTGSGKTEVYIDAVLKAKSLGLGSLIIVPEIALTPQLIDRFKARFGDDLAILHSALSKRARWDSWMALYEGKARIAIGVRSGIFAPVNNLGLIIVDEEHDGSFKQSEGLRYNARDLAVLRAQFENCPVVLGSATPSLESYNNAGKRKYNFLVLPLKSDRGSNVVVNVVDLNKVKFNEMVSNNISPALHTAIKKTIENDGQAFILYNRRGFSSFLQCSECDEVLECKNCSVTLTYHLGRNSLLCHYCGASHPPPSLCPHCIVSEGTKAKPDTLTHRGAGTERVFDELTSLFPEATIDRLDRDVASSMDDYKLILDRVRAGTTKILVGTQMIAKGHDLPNVTLVGIVDCDVGLHMPDFRARERGFQLLTQAAGRAGRGDKIGEVILQTRLPNHLSIRKTVVRDFISFANEELISRNELSYPPFARLLRVLVTSEDPEAGSSLLLTFREQTKRWIELSGKKISILGPSLAPIERIKGLYRSHLIFKSKSPTTLISVVQLLKQQKVAKGIKVIFDIDPQDML